MNRTRIGGNIVAKQLEMERLCAGQGQSHSQLVVLFNCSPSIPLSVGRKCWLLVCFLRDQILCHGVRVNERAAVCNVSS